MNGVKIETLYEFVTLAGKCNFLESAEELFISQSTLSRHIKEMEKELGVVLFQRSTRKVTLTNYGLMLLPYAKEILALQEKYLTKITEQLEAEKHRIIIGTFSKQDDVGIADMISDFQLVMPDVYVKMYWNESDDLLKLLQNELCDFAFMRELTADSDEDFIRIPFAEDNIKVFLPRQHPLARQDVVRIEQLKNEPFFMTEDSSLTSKLTMMLCHNAGFEPDIMLHGSKQQIFNMMNKGIGVTLLFKNNYVDIWDYNTVALDLEPKAFAYINLVYLRGRKLTAVQQKFLNYVKTESFPRLGEGKGESAKGF